MTSQTSLLRRSMAAAMALGTTGALLAGCGGGGSVSLNGAGASFPAAIYQRWFQDLAAEGVQVNYQSVGSGAGVRQFIAGTVDFGASDVPMKDEEIAKVSRGVLQIPMTAGAIAVAYNNPGCELKLSQEQLAGIFLGKITELPGAGLRRQDDQGGAPLRWLRHHRQLHHPPGRHQPGVEVRPRMPASP